MRGFSLLVVVGIFGAGCSGGGPPPTLRKFQRVPPDKVHLDAFSKTKKLTLKITSTGSGEKMGDIARRAIMLSGIPVVEKGGDGEFIVKVETIAIAGTYNNVGRQYSGAGVAGHFAIDIPGMVQPYRINFEGVVKPPTFIAGNFSTVDKAPYESAALKPDGMLERLFVFIHEVYGPAPLIWVIQNPASNEIGDKAAEALGDFGHSDSIKVFQQTILVEDRVMRMRALKGFARHKSAESLKILIREIPASEKAVFGSDELIVIAQGIGDHGDPSGVEPLLELFKRRDEMLLGQRIADAMHKLTGEWASSGNRDRAIVVWTTWLNQHNRAQKK